MIYVEIRDGVVTCTRDAPYPPQNPWTIEAPEHVECGWTYDGTTWAEPPDLTRAKAITKTRQGLAQQWAGLPAWIRGPFWHHFERASACLDAGHYDEAEAIIQYAEPAPGYDADQTEAFLAARRDFAAAIAQLAKLSAPSA